MCSDALSSPMNHSAHLSFVKFQNGQDYMEFGRRVSRLQKLLERILEEREAADLHCFTNSFHQHFFEQLLFSRSHIICCREIER